MLTLEGYGLPVIIKRGFQSELGRTGKVRVEQTKLMKFQNLCRTAVTSF